METLVIFTNFCIDISFYSLNMMCFLNKDKALSPFMICKGGTNDSYQRPLSKYATWKSGMLHMGMQDIALGFPTYVRFIYLWTTTFIYFSLVRIDVGTTCRQDHALILLTGIISVTKIIMRLKLCISFISPSAGTTNLWHVCHTWYNIESHSKSKLLTMHGFRLVEFA